MKENCFQTLNREWFEAGKLYNNKSSFEVKSPCIYLRTNAHTSSSRKEFFFAASVLGSKDGVPEGLTYFLEEIMNECPS